MALGHVAFDYIENRLGPTTIHHFLTALIVPRLDNSRTVLSIFNTVLDDNR